MTNPDFSYVFSSEGITVSWKIDTALQKNKKLSSPEFEFSNARWQLSWRYDPYKRTNVHVVKLWCREIEEGEEIDFWHEICIKNEKKEVLKRVRSALVFSDNSHNFLQLYGSESELLSCRSVQCRIFYPKDASDDESDEEECEDGGQDVGSYAFTLTEDFKTALETGRHSDVVLKVGDASFPAHKMVLSCRSKVFQAMFDSDTKENTENVVDLVEMDAAVARIMLHYMYTGKAEELRADNMIGLYTVADRYSLLELLMLCRQFILSHIEVENVCEVAILADLHSDDALKKATQEFFCKHLNRVFQSETLVREAMFEKNFQLFYKLIKEGIV